MWPPITRRGPIQHLPRIAGAGYPSKTLHTARPGERSGINIASKGRNGFGFSAEKAPERSQKIYKSGGYLVTRLSDDRFFCLFSIGDGGLPDGVWVRHVG